MVKIPKKEEVRADLRTSTQIIQMILEEELEENIDKKNREILNQEIDKIIKNIDQI